MSEIIEEVGVVDGAGERRIESNVGDADGTNVGWKTHWEYELLTKRHVKPSTQQVVPFQCAPPHFPPMDAQSWVNWGEDPTTWTTIWMINIKDEKEQWSAKCMFTSQITWNAQNERKNTAIMSLQLHLKKKLASKVADKEKASRMDWDDRVRVLWHLFFNWLLFSLMDRFLSGSEFLRCKMRPTLTQPNDGLFDSFFFVIFVLYCPKQMCVDTNIQWRFWWLVLEQW
jgi:hypothetical protein